MRSAPNCSASSLIACSSLVWRAFDGSAASSSGSSPGSKPSYFGTFSVSKRAARKGRNPATGVEIKIPASKVAKFSAGAKLKKAVNKR